MQLWGKSIELHFIQLSPATEQVKQGQGDAASPPWWLVETGAPCLGSS